MIGTHEDVRHKILAIIKDKEKLFQSSEMAMAKEETEILIYGATDYDKEVNRAVKSMPKASANS